ncbi:phosphatase PAP2 family protein [Sphingomonas naphthae]|uniref:Phosphatase PAP2 family protein n=1 Tax=Sphingomonas naphthae TaxID=1813468 RepID=A0ABY7TH35_9SPHN|nr:phosphatase PAP2 family protein [Sphingomonas naphthae]WCT72542.1 phosphatase PAP2 family protein [Sphingomonas naphthae]
MTRPAKRSKPRKATETVEVAASEKAAPLRRTWFVRATGQLSELADQPPLITICAVTALAGIAFGNRRLASAGARMLTAELIATAAKDAIKARVDRTRPRVVADGGRYRSGKGGTKDSAHSSFPSGHTAGAVAVARAVAREYPAAATPAYAVASGVAAIQVPRSQHYPSDLAVGALIGVAAEAVAYGAERLLARRWPAREVEAPLLLLPAPTGT